MTSTIPTLLEPSDGRSVPVASSRRAASPAAVRAPNAAVRRVDGALRDSTARLPPQLARLAEDDPRIARVAIAARDFRRRFIDPVALELDQRLLQQPDYTPYDIIRRGCDYGWLTLLIPAFLGGGGLGTLHVAVLLEELSAGCAGIANIFGAHYLGLAPPLLALDLNHMDTWFTEVVSGEAHGEPVLFATAVTEPSAGTDVEDADLLPKARLSMSARRVDNGYVLRGRKVFISNGSIARYVSVVCAIDKQAPLSSWSAFVVPTNARGFSVGRVERKMGQRACHAAELIFDDCFISGRHRIGIEGRGMDMTSVVLAGSRAPVAAIATGIARGAFERVLSWCRNQRSGSSTLARRPWVQARLGEMAAQIQLARAAYIEAAGYFDATNPATRLGRSAVSEGVLRLTGPMRRSALGRRVTAAPVFKRLMTARALARDSQDTARTALGLASWAKLSASDAAVGVCLQALNLCGAAGGEERLGLEKCLRDAKLTQIYEGTNQLNQHAVYKNLLSGVTL